MRTLSAALSLVLLAAAAGAEGPNLWPIFWKDAGFETGAAQPPIQVEICDADQCASATAVPGDRVVVDLLGAHVEADVVSRIAGNRHEHGFENLVYAGPPGIQRVSVSASIWASYVVPVLQQDATTPVAIVDDRLTLLGGTKSELGISRVEVHVASDTITVHAFATWELEAPSSSQAVTGCGVDQERPGVVLDDCLGSVELLLPLGWPQP